MKSTGDQLTRVNCSLVGKPTAKALGGCGPLFGVAVLIMGTVVVVWIIQFMNAISTPINDGSAQTAVEFGMRILKLTVLVM